VPHHTFTFTFTFTPSPEPRAPSRETPSHETQTFAAAAVAVAVAVAVEVMNKMNYQPSIYRLLTRRCSVIVKLMLFIPDHRAIRVHEAIRVPRRCSVNALVIPDRTAIRVHGDQCEEWEGSVSMGR
jgi:hypothetical protein